MSRVAIVLSVAEANQAIRLVRTYTGSFSGAFATAAARSLGSEFGERPSVAAPAQLRGDKVT